MEIELKEIKQFPAELNLSASVDELDFVLEEVRLRDGVAVEVNIQRTDEEYFVTGETTATVETDCARCLEPATVELRGRLSFVALRLTAEDRTKYSGSDEEVIELDKEEVLSLDEQLRQALQADVPLKPLCAEDCLGLCPSCGTNRNISSCRCETQKRDPRWDALKDMIEE